MAISSLPLHLCGKADALDSGSDLFGTRLVWLESHLRRAHLHRIYLYSRDTLKRSTNPTYAALAMHSFDRQCERIPHDISPSIGIDANTPPGYSSYAHFWSRKLNSSCRLPQTLHPGAPLPYTDSGPRNRNGRLAQLVRAPALQAGCRGFESLTAHHIFNNLGNLRSITLGCCLLSRRMKPAGMMSRLFHLFSKKTKCTESRARHPTLLIRCSSRLELGIQSIDKIP